jgi:hypothetical protein
MSVRWPPIRAGLIAFAIVLGLVDGCPLPSPGKGAPWQRAVAEPIRGAQQVALRPFAWIGERLRIGQRWALYQAPVADKHRLWIDGRDGRGQWHVLFRAGDHAHQEDADLIDYTRPRGAWDPVGVLPQQYPLFAEWVIARALARHPEFLVVRVQLERVRLTTDGVVPTGVFIETRARNRARNLP